MHEGSQDEIPARGLSDELKLRCLLTEYTHVREDTRLFHRRLDGMFVVFSVLVLGSISFVLANPNNDIIWCIIPFTMLIVSHIVFALDYVLITQSLEVRRIEHEVNMMNGGEPLLKWEHVTNRHALGKFLVRLSGRGAKIALPNPLYMLYIFIFGGMFIVFYYSLHRARVWIWSFSAYYAVLYVTTVICLGLVTLLDFFLLLRYTAVASEEQGDAHEWH